MVARSVVLMMIVLLGISGPVAQAKVSPALELEQQFSAQQLQQLIDDFPYRGVCDLGRVLLNDGSGSMSIKLPFNNGAGQDTCLLPVPKPDVFENIAQVI